MVENNQISQDNSTVKRLYRSRENRIVGGVCGGLAEYFDVDPLLVRIPWILITIFGGIGIIAYIIGLIIIPQNPYQEPASSHEGSGKQDKAAFWGILLIILGAVFLLREFDLFYYFNFWEIPWQIIWASFLIMFGVFLLVNRRSGNNAYATAQDADTISRRQFHRVSKNKMVAGVCSGLASYFDIDVTLVRLAWITLTLASVGIGILAYIILVIVFPEMED
jgi:phage shock protein PspC (stress-responsive transcriptional regulator)